jgi:hypothetical protein
MGAQMRLRSCDDVRQLTAYLQTVADWREGFERRVELAQESLEAGTLSEEEQDQLLEEGAAILQLIHRLMGSERRAA